jgi:preprotein translocase subunit SecA
MKYLAERSQNSAPRYDREGLASWVESRYHETVDVAELQPLLRPEIEMKLIELAHRRYEGAKLADELAAKLAAAKIVDSPGDKNGTPHHSTDVTALVAWAQQSLGLEISPEAARSLPTNELRRYLVNALDAKHRPEMREMEKAVLLQILDSSWMEHLRAMDHLRSSIGLQGYAQIDPKVEYKREGMRIFAEMWVGIADRVTDLIFRVEHFDPEFLNYLGSRWNLDRAKTIHDQAESQLAAAPVSGGVRQQQDAAIAASQRSADSKREPVRNVAKKVGRNDPCPCGSGKKFKACCMRKQSSLDAS